MLFQRYAQKKYTKSPQSRDSLKTLVMCCKSAGSRDTPSHELPQPVVLSVIVGQNFVRINKDEVSASRGAASVENVSASADLGGSRRDIEATMEGGKRLIRIWDALHENSRAWEHE
jgi:hypothetical protein